jgi:hypothetical protein
LDAAACTSKSPEPTVRQQRADQLHVIVPAAPRILAESDDARASMRTDGAVAGCT